jgi:site-specific recombinase XerD
MNREIADYKAHLVNLERSQRTISGYIGELYFFQNWMEERFNGPITIDDITGNDINEFLLHLKEERGYKPASRRRLAATLKGFFKWAYKHGYIDVDLAETVPSIKVPDNERHFLSPEEVKTWVDAVDHDVSKVAIWIMYYAGLRINEATNLRMDDVQLDEDGGWLIVRRGKGGKYRRVPIAPALAEILRDYMTWRVDSEYLLATKKTGHISSVTIQAELREARRKLGWSEDITPHILRHSFASQVYQKTQDILVVSKLLGHTNLTTTQVYAHLHDACTKTHFGIRCLGH